MYPRRPRCRQVRVTMKRRPESSVLVPVVIGTPCSQCDTHDWMDGRRLFDWLCVVFSDHTKVVYRIREGCLQRSKYYGTEIFRMNYSIQV